MNSSRDVILSFFLPDTGDGAADLKTFTAVWQSLHEKNAHLLRETRAILCLSVAPGALRESVTSFIAASGAADGAAVHHICDASWGRCFNDAFLFAVSCDRARFWLHLDEDHVCVRPFWRSAVAVLRGAGAHLWQLQITDFWEDLPEERLLQGDGFTEVVPYHDLAARAAIDVEDYEDAEPYLSMWPVFSLRPGVFALEHLRGAVAAGLSLRPFDESAGWEALQWRFGSKLERLRGRKGVLAPAGFEYADGGAAMEDDDASQAPGSAGGGWRVCEIYDP